MGPRAAFVLLVLSLCLFGPTARAEHFTSPWTASDIVPSRMVGTHLDEEIHVTRVRVGTPERELLLVLDFAGQSLVVSSAPSRRTSGDVAGSNPADWSSSYSPSGGGSDLVRLSGHRYRLPTTFDTTAAAVMGCPACNGVLGVGPGSPIWLVWPDATFSAGAITLGRRQPPVTGSGRARIACEVLDDNLCTSTAEVFGVDYRVRFRFRSAYTVVPGAVYDAYVGTRSVSNTPVDSWPHLTLLFESADAPVDPRKPKLRIAPQSLVGDSRHGGARTLMIKRSADPLSDEIVLGRTAWRSLMMYREFVTGHAVIQTFDSTKRFPTWSLAVAVIAAIAIARWWMTRDALFYESQSGQFADTGVRAINATMRRSTAVSRRLANYLRSTGAMPAGASVWNWEGGLSGPYLSGYPGEWGVYPDRLLIELLAVPGAIATLYVPALRNAADSRIEFWIFMQVITYLAVVWLAVVWVARLAGRADAFGVLHYNIQGGSSSFVVYRAGLMRQAAVDMLFAIILVMLSMLTRTDTLGTTMIALASGILSGVALYHFVNSVIHVLRFRYRYPVGQRGVGIWVLWIIVSGLTAAAVAAFVSIFVLVPFMQLHVTSANPGDYILVTAVVYAVGLYVAFVLADHEADRMELWMRKRRVRAAATLVRKRRPPTQRRQART